MASATGGTRTNGEEMRDVAESFKSSLNLDLLYSIKVKS